jgi:iron complex outermembrane receptor protein
MNFSRLLGTTALRSVAVLSLVAASATPALAQQTAPEDEDAPKAPDETDIQSGEDVTTADPSSQATITVTGSRIRQPEFTSPDPVTRIDPATAMREGKFDTADMLQSSPIAAGSTQITSAISSNFVTNGGPGAQTIDLRGLGANRTLVLLNGRRAGPAGTRGGVSSFDLNVLPQSIVSRVDILKTGASSIYGSDAIAGVVNIITKTDTDGIELDANVNVPFRSNGEQYRVAALWGKTFDRGHVMIAADYFKQNELARGDRNYLGCPEAYIFKPGGGDARADLIDPRTGQYHCEDLRWGHLWTYDLEKRFQIGPGNLFTTTGAYAGGLGTVALLQFQYPGETLGIPPINPHAGLVNPFTSPPGWFPTGYDAPSTAVQNAYHPFVLEQSLVPSTERFTLYGEAAFEISDAVEVYGEFLANRRKTYQNGWRQFWTFGYTGDLYGDGAYGTYWAQGFTGFNWISPTGITNNSDASQKVDYWRGVGGLRGDISSLLKGWSYDAFVQYSHNKGRYRDQQILQDVYDISYFQTSSCVGTVTPVSKKQCIDLPWTNPYFLAGQMTPEQVAFLFDWEEGKTIYTQLSGEASVSGPLFRLPAGNVAVALGVTARRDEITDTPGLITQAGNAWGSTQSGITAGHSMVTEAFGEIQIPVLKEKPFFRDLSLSGAARLTNVKSVRTADQFTDEDNGNWTYKLGANWAVNDWLRFRATYGTSFRSPALFEQFKSNETGFVNARTIDPCVQWASNLAQGNISQTTAENCAAAGIPNNYTGGSITATVFSQGGIGILDPETSVARTASIILTPRFSFLPDTRFSLAVDYFRIRVKNEVSQLGEANIVAGCYASEFYPDEPLCDLFTRGNSGDPLAIGTIQDKYINIANQVNEGIDFTALLQQDLGRLGKLNLLGSVTYQMKDTFALFVNTEQSFNGEIGDPKWVGDFNLSLQTGNGWGFFWGTEVYGKASNRTRFENTHGGSLCPPTPSLAYGSYCVKVDVPTIFYHAASITKEFDNFTFTIGVRNIFDQKPPRVSIIGGSGLPTMIGPVVGTSQYDFLGRRAFVNVSAKF